MVRFSRSCSCSELYTKLNTLVAQTGLPLPPDGKAFPISFWQGHPTDCFGRISVRKTCNRLKFSVREMSSRAFLNKIN